MTSLDLARAAETFERSTDLTVGLEEEFAILDPETLDLIPRFEELSSTADGVLREAICGELISSEIEIVSGAGSDLREAIAAQRERRRLLFAHAAAHGATLGATGTHPWADYRQQRIIDTEHYRRVSSELRYVAARNNTFSLHVHVGVQGIDRAVKTCDRLRPVLPLLLAVSANSPMLDGCDSGLHSARTQVFTKSFPRCGVPDTYGGWDAYRDYLELLMRTQSIVEHTQIWWSVRPHLRFGTVEVRICDAQATAAESEALAGLIVACVAQAVRDTDEGAPFVDVPRRLIEENMWRAIRHGLDGRMIDAQRGVEYESATIVERLERWTEPARADLALQIAAAALSENGAQRQRAMLRDGATLEEVYACMVRETNNSYPQEVSV